MGWDLNQSFDTASQQFSDLAAAQECFSDSISDSEVAPNNRMSEFISFSEYTRNLIRIFITSAIAGILLKPQDFHFFQ